MLLKFGKHKGKDLRDVPESYLQWLLDNATNLTPALKQEIINILTPSPSIGQIGKWYRSLALAYHPDKGGTNEQMKVVNYAYESLLKILR